MFRAFQVIAPAALLIVAGLSGTGLAQASPQPLDTLKVCATGGLTVGDNDMSVKASGHVMFQANNAGTDLARIAVFTPQSPNEGGSAWIETGAQHDWHFNVTSSEPVQWAFSVSELATNHNPTDVKYQILSDNCF